MNHTMRVGFLSDLFASYFMEKCEKIPIFGVEKCENIE